MNDNAQDNTAQDNTAVSKEDAKKLKKAYYDEGYVFGRDNLYHIMKQKYPDENERPSRRTVMKWLKKQKLHQVYGQTRSGGTTNYFVPKKPFYSISMDLLDFNARQSGPFKYVLVVIDNFSRWMATTPLTSKKAKTTAQGIKKIFDKIKDDYGQEALDNIKHAITDDGGEFKGEFEQVLSNMKTADKPNGIDIKRSLGGHPQQNGLIERQNGRLKMILAKLIQIKGGSWSTRLQKATDLNNKQFIRTTGYTPNEALQLKPDEYVKLKENVKKNRADDLIIQKEFFKEGERVRLKKNKGTLGKASTPNWSDKVYTIAKVIKNKNPQIADKYLIVGRGEKQFYSRNDLQRVVGEVEDIPVRLTQQQRKEIADYLRLDESSIVDGEFSEETIQKAKEAFEKKYPDAFEEIAEKTKKQLERLKEDSLVEGETVERPKRQTKQVTRLDPSQKKKKQEEYVIEKLVAVRKNQEGDTEYLVKWDGYDSDQNTWEPEFNKKTKGQKKRERRIPIQFVKEFKKNSS